MKIDETKQAMTEMLENADNKSEAIVECIEKVVSVQSEAIVERVIAESAKAESDAEFKKSLGLRNLSEKETKFYEALKDVKQALTANQIDFIPTTIVDRTLDGLKKDSGIMTLINFAPADVKRWLVASYTGTATWGSIFSGISDDIETEITGLDIEVNKLTALLFIPKAVRDLALPYVDRYFTAVLAEVMKDGIIKGYLNGDGKTAPIGIMRKIDAVETDSTHSAKEVVSTVTSFSPKALAPIRKVLNNNGKRAIGKLYLICNPADEADYVDPALFHETADGYRQNTFLPIVKIAEPNMEVGKAIFTIENAYTMGLSAVKVEEYKEAKALDDVDTVIAKCYGNGRAIDDNCAVVFDVTKLEEYIPTYRLADTVEG